MEKRGQLKRPSLMIQVVIGAVIGTLLGYLSPAVGMEMEFLGTLFMNFIQMVIVPLIFPLIVLAIVEISKAKRFGNVAFKSFAYFFVVTTFLIVLTLIIGALSNVGNGLLIDSISTEALDGIANSIDFRTFILGIIPRNVFQAFADGNLLPIIFFGIFLGISLVTIQEKAKPVLDFFDAWVNAMFKMVNYAIAVAPIGVFGFLAYDVATYGVSNLVSLGQFVIWAYLAYAIVAFIVYPIIGLGFKVPYFSLLKETSDLSLLAFSTGSSSVVLPSLIDRLKKFGVPSSVASFVTTLGYSFNLGGAAVYTTLAVMFVVNLYGASLNVTDYIALVFFLTIITKSIAAVPSGAVVVLLASATQLGLPPQGVALLVSIDFFVNAGRTALNVVGNALAPVVIAKTEGKFVPSGVLNEKESSNLVK
ncbi:dicarboxylate/amino acid:cation symporter [Desemzia incerta]|uniref:dicarboxylate/amino acid:cation symporter n=1 Tax=Desemzia incerta TaxID=82801 RepID=UPI0024C33D52|nr:dicarboxylate/amino acid:cation symporter [Desemzia incerta]WHZ31913.1 dicarboxylate/amino acid:cation symporter [Desemzia incerta]